MAQIAHPAAARYLLLRAAAPFSDQVWLTSPGPAWPAVALPDAVR
jgi:hypothetical protein